MWKFVAFLAILAFSEARVALPIQEAFNQTTYANECQINVNGDLGLPQPLVIVPGTDKFFHPQTNEGIIRMNTGQTVEVFCSDSFQGTLSSSPATLTCQADGKFASGGKSYAFKDLYCAGWPAHSARKNGKTCYQGAIMIEIGFVVGSRFLKIMEICFDEKLERTHYVHHEFIPANSKFQSGVDRPSSWYKGGFFGTKNVDNLYTKNTQRDTIAKIVGSASLAANYVQDTGNTFMARGHLSAKSDYIFGSEQRATFYFVNVHPQWQDFNAGNWQRVEDSIQKFAGARNVNLEAYTGTFQTGSLIDVNGRWQEIYLDFDSNNNGLIPMPKIYYKIVINKANRYGVALIGVNNPHVTLADIQRDYTFCTDVSSKINWVNWDRTNIRLGYSYACEVNELAARVQHLPALDVKGLLV